MLTRKRLIKLFALLVVVSLLISACDRPLPGGGDDPTPTAEGYPSAGEEGAAGGEEAVGEPEPTREVLAEGETPAETGEEAGEPVGEPVEEPAEGSEGQEGVAEEATVTPEVMAEEETGEEVAETPAEGEPEAAPEGAEETAEPEAEAQPTEETAPEVAEESQSAEGETAQPSGGQPLPATHTVAAGENLYRIGLQYGISWVAIARHNNITNPDRIYTGQVLQIPSGDSGSGGQPPPVPTPMGINYIVKPGDTLFKIGLQFGISWTEIAEANGLVNPNQIYAGQTLKIPVDAPAPPQVIHHVVQPGETLFRISLQYGVPWMAIAQANHIGPPFYIYAGQTLVIPGGH
jgi:LysM repeat protein